MEGAVGVADDEKEASGELEEKDREASAGEPTAVGVESEEEETEEVAVWETGEETDEEDDAAGETIQGPFSAGR